MELAKAYQTVMEETANMALATCVNGKPNVRIVTFGFDSAKPDTVYFTAFRGSQKIRDFEQNDAVALMPLPENPAAPAQVRIFGTVTPAEDADAVIQLISATAPEFAGVLSANPGAIVAYKVTFSEAWLTIGTGDAQALAV